MEQRGYWLDDRIKRAGSWNPAVSDFATGNGTDGSNVAFAEPNGSLSQTLSTNFDSTLNYQLTVDVGRRLTYNPGAYTVQLFAGATLLGSYASSNLEPGSWGTIKRRCLRKRFRSGSRQRFADRAER